ncbi:hypothetical protein GRS96_20400 (plasmid) [Rathayibacter sp. VKM Ac-2803]|uniref:hypothetical protein n=1 Tax=Rathayibacter sp. VKM Ac-2803 TaxID=2609256 RepID=UPI00135B20DB|nr:hypothetical protein [Rathayibacter sp. VKM Ac-2803]MWV51629.1 hypothetical protein [Rathayibacter sp. VKM Ac-2803]
MSEIDPASYVPNLFWNEGWPEEGTDPNPPAYQGTPPGITPGRVPLALTLGESDRAIVLLTTVKAYPTGVSMIVSCLLRRASAETDIGDPISEGRILLTLEMPDGHQLGGTDPLPEYEYLAELRTHPERARDEAWMPGHPVLRRAGAGGGASFEQAYWLWPLPSPGLIRVSCEWPEQGIAATTHQFDAQLLRDAAAEARPQPLLPGR